MTRAKPNVDNYEKVYQSVSENNYMDEPFGADSKVANMGYIAIDRQVDRGYGDEKAIRWEGIKKEDTDYDVTDRTYKQVMENSNKFANLLEELGAKKGDKIVVYSELYPEATEAMVGALKAGLVLTPVFPSIHGQGLTARINYSDAKYVVVDSRNYANLKKAEDSIENDPKRIIIDKSPVDDDLYRTDDVIYSEMDNILEDKVEDPKSYNAKPMDASDPAFMIFTSGTTSKIGMGKGIVHTHGSIGPIEQVGKYALDLHPGDNYWCGAHIGWITGITQGELAAYTNGATRVQYEGRFVDPDRYYEILQDSEVDVFFTAPTVLRRLKELDESVDMDYDFSSLRQVYCVGEHLAENVIEWGEDKFEVPVLDTYFQTELCHPVIANYPTEKVKPGYMGKPVPGVYATIIDQDGKELPPDKKGLLVLKKYSSMMSDVYKNRKKYESYFMDGETLDGEPVTWYLTGDVAIRTKDNSFKYQGRSDDLIITSGENVLPPELENSIMEGLPYVTEVGVFGLPDELRGQAVCVTLRPTDKCIEKLDRGEINEDAIIKDVKKIIKDDVASYAVPRDVYISREKLPTTQSGKIKRNDLQKMYGEEE